MNQADGAPLGTIDRTAVARALDGRFAGTVEAGLRNVALVLMHSVDRLLAAGGACGVAALQAGLAAGDADGKGGGLDVDGPR